VLSKRSRALLSKVSSNRGYYNTYLCAGWMLYLQYGWRAIDIQPLVTTLEQDIMYWYSLSQYSMYVQLWMH